MEAHSVLKSHGINVTSFGTGSAVRLPGPTPTTPYTYPFLHPYYTIHASLPAATTPAPLLAMLQRNSTLKPAPERFQDSGKSHSWDMVITCEERCYDAVMEELNSRREEQGRPTVVVNVEIRDCREEAVRGAQVIWRLVQKAEEKENLIDSCDELLEDFGQEIGERASKLYYTLCFS